jgi:hypothetical protein
MLALVLAVLAQTGDYPRVVHKGDQTCVESLDLKGKVVSECRSGSGDYRPATGREPSTDAKEPARSSQSLPDPVVSAPSLRMRTPGTSYYSPEVAALLHSAQTKYYWGLGFKIAAAPLMLYSLVGLISLAAQSGQGGLNAPSTGGALAGNLVILAGAALCVIIGVLVDNSAGADVDAAANL